MNRDDFEEWMEEHTNPAGELDYTDVRALYEELSAKVAELERMVESWKWAADNGCYPHLLTSGKAWRCIKTTFEAARVPMFDSIESLADTPEEAIAKLREVVEGK